MGIKKISELVELNTVNNEDLLAVVDSTNGETKKVEMSKLLSGLVPNNAGAHNAIYRGKNITDKFYDGTLSQQIANQTFDDIFVGDYIIGKVSNRKYLVADINYRLHAGDTELKTPHVLIIPERSMGTAVMNDTNVTTGGYIGSKMYVNNLAAFKTVIQNDFETNHILKHRNILTNAVTNGYASGGSWYDSDIELMNECMVYGGQIFNNVLNSTNLPYSYTIDKSQLSIFKHRHDLIIGLDDSGARISWWLRDVASAAYFASVTGTGGAGNGSASIVRGVRPAFLIY